MPRQALRSAPNAFSQGGVVKANTAKNPFRLLTAFAATFPKGTASAVAGSFVAAPKGVPLGELPNAVRLRGYFVRKKAPEGGCSPGKKGLMILYLLPL